MFGPQSCEAEDLQLDVGRHLCAKISMLALLGVIMDSLAELPAVLAQGQHTNHLVLGSDLPFFAVCSLETSASPCRSSSDSTPALAGFSAGAMPVVGHPFQHRGALSVLMV